MGAQRAWVPPRTTTRLGAGARASGSARVCSTSATEPALPMSKVCSPPRTRPGRKESRGEPSTAPLTAASQMAAAARTQVRCCRNSPARGLRARMRSSTNGVPVSIDSERAVRRI
jgi:hypothetical protein